MANHTTTAAATGASGAHGDAAGHGDGEHTRRDFLTIMAGSWALVGGAAALWPMIDQMNPDANTRALSTIEVDLAPIKSGQAVTVLWQGKAVFIRNRTDEEIKKAEATPVDQLKDTTAQNAALPDDADARDENRVKPGKANWLVMVGVCTHLGCIPKGQAPGDMRGEYGGWFCPCHGSQYDISGRIRKGPAPLNLLVPKYAFLTDTKIKIG